MIRLSLIALAVLSLGASAETTKQTLERIGNNANLANGSWDVARYNTNSFTEKAAVYRMTNLRPSNRYCKYGTTTTTKNVFSALREADRESGVDSAVGKLYRNRQVRFMVHRFNTEGESESCSHSLFEIYTVDGYRLGLYYDFTD